MGARCPARASPRPWYSPPETRYPMAASNPITDIDAVPSMRCPFAGAASCSALFGRSVALVRCAAESGKRPPGFAKHAPQGRAQVQIAAPAHTRHLSCRASPRLSRYSGTAPEHSLPCGPSSTATWPAPRTAIVSLSADRSSQVVQTRAQLPCQRRIALIFFSTASDHLPTCPSSSSDLNI